MNLNAQSITIFVLCKMYLKGVKSKKKIILIYIFKIIIIVINNNNNNYYFENISLKKLNDIKAIKVSHEIIKVNFQGKRLFSPWFVFVFFCLVVT